MQIEGLDSDHIVNSDEIGVITTLSLSAASHLRAVLSDRTDARMEGSPLYAFLTDLDQQIRNAQIRATQYAHKLEELDRRNRYADDDVVQPVTETVREIANVR
tara:strand:+ start:571 stop:879 length:309 start_codon:yes stop_codon:yes gene_type:complete